MVETLEQNRARLRKLRQDRPEWNAAKNAAWKAKNKEKHRAHKAVEYALSRGRLTKAPCERCGDTRIVHAHHDDYTQMLSVMWLCPLHHRERHRELECSGETARAA